VLTGLLPGVLICLSLHFSSAQEYKRQQTSRLALQQSKPHE
jgi:hypothetical protein